jgi:nucleoside-triphosphatase THEP1
MEVPICYSIESLNFIDSVKNLLVIVDKNVIVVIHQKLQHHLIEQFKKKSRLIINLDLENRAKVNQILVNRLLVE